MAHDRIDRHVYRYETGNVSRMIYRLDAMADATLCRTRVTFHAPWSTGEEFEFVMDLSSWQVRVDEQAVGRLAWNASVRDTLISGACIYECIVYQKLLCKCGERNEERRAWLEEILRAVESSGGLLRQTGGAINKKRKWMLRQVGSIVFSCASYAPGRTKLPVTAFESVSVPSGCGRKLFARIFHSASKATLLCSIAPVRPVER